jgi:trk system potassium uptake protein TrkA
MAKQPKRFIVIGAGRFGSSVAITLSKSGADVIVIDKNKDRVLQISDYVTQAVQLDAMDEKALKSVGVEKADVAIVSIGVQMEASILVTMTLKEMGIPSVVSKALTESHGKVLARVGADKIVFPERDMGAKLAKSLVSPTILDHIEVSPGYNIIELNVPEFLQGDSIMKSKVRTKYGVEIIAVKKNTPQLNGKGESVLDEEVLIAPAPETVLEEGDTIIVIGKEDAIERFRRRE